MTRIKMKAYYATTKKVKRIGNFAISDNPALLTDII